MYPEILSRDRAPAARNAEFRSMGPYRPPQQTESGLETPQRPFAAEPLRRSAGEDIAFSARPQELASADPTLGLLVSGAELPGRSLGAGPAPPTQVEP